MRVFLFRILQVIFVFAIIGILSPASVVGQTTSNNATIAGRVMDGTGAVLHMATVRLYSDPEGKTSLAETTTNVEGEYSISTSAGAFILSVSAERFQTTKKEVRVNAGEQVRQDISLQIAGVSQSISVVGEGVYVAPEATAGTKSETPLLETPMAVQVVPRQVIEDRQASTTEEVVKNVSGIQAGQYLFYDQFMIRGFYSGYGTTFRNGLQLRSLNEVENMAFVDHVEVIKGPSSMLYGRVEPGGFVNIVTKKPQETSSISMEQQLGSWGAVRTTLDATGKLNRRGTLLYRVMFDYDKVGSWVTNMHRNDIAGAATLTWKPNSKFTSNLQIENYAYATAWLDDSIPVVGNRPANLPRNFSIIFPESWTAFPYTVRRTLLAYDWSYALTKSWKLTNRFHYLHSNEDQQGVYATWWAFDGVNTFPAVHFTNTGPNWIRNMYNTNIDLSGEFSTGPIKHKVLVGFDWAKFTDDTPGSDGDIPGAIPLNMNNPVYTSYLTTLQSIAATDATNIIWRDRSNDTGVYFQDQISLSRRWDVLFGGRYDWATDAYSNTYGNLTSSCYPHCTGYPITPYPTDTAFSPRAALLYKISSMASVYGSYARSFGDSNGRDNNGNPLKPQIATQYEVGVKASLRDGSLTTSATFFNLTKSNITEYDPATFFPRLVGEARSRGLELDLAGQLTKRVSLIGSYTYDQAIITKDLYNGTLGNMLGGVAPNVASLWLKYDSAPGMQKGWAAGAGTYLTGQREGDDNNTWQLPGYGRVDAMLAYRTIIQQMKVSFQFNVNNLTDKTYFDHGSSGIASYGAPRTLSVATRVRF